MHVSCTELAFTEFNFGILIIFPCKPILVLSLSRGVSFIRLYSFDLSCSDCFEVSKNKFTNVWVNLRHQLPRLKVKQGEGYGKITFQEADWLIKTDVIFRIIKIRSSRRVITISLLSLYIQRT
jgi:hypothetical protein